MYVNSLPEQDSRNIPPTISTPTKTSSLSIDTGSTSNYTSTYGSTINLTCHQPNWYEYAKKWFYCISSHKYSWSLSHPFWNVYCLYLPGITTRSLLSIIVLYKHRCKIYLMKRQSSTSTTTLLYYIIYTVWLSCSSLSIY